MMKRARKTRRQLQAEKFATASDLVQKANELTNPLEPLVNFHKFTANDGTIIDLSCHRVTDLPEETIKWIFDLTERNMKFWYEQSHWGWNAAAKQAELTENSAWYLIASSSGKLIGFSHFRFDLDDRTEVLYCYEIQLEPLERRKGLGRFMMQALEAMAAKTQMQKVILTVIKRNLRAVAFFAKLSYKMDITNPPASEKPDYAIFSKKNLRV